MHQDLAYLLVLFVILINKSDGKFDKDYIVKTSKCMIPDINPFSEEIENITMRQSYLPCYPSELPSHIEKNDSKTAILYVKHNLLPKNASCCFSYATRNGTEGNPDYGVSFSQCENFQNYVTLTHDTVKVECWTKSSLVYENVHNTVLKTPTIERKLDNHNKAMSVLLVVVDSVSNLNFKRTMRKSFEFLEKNDFVEMKGYTKIGENTFPNFIALLTGFDLSTAKSVCQPTVIGGLDSCPMIWYDYRNLGYITAYAEDNSPIATFNYDKKGFKEPPTDYYFKPYIDASEVLKKKYHNSMPYCTGPETAGERILNTARDFANTFKGQPSFGIFWMNTFSHDDVNAPYGMDEKFKDFFADLKSNGILDESIVMVLSDHGIRFGDIRATNTGWFEERMPINMISVPTKFQKKFPEKFNNLKKNSEKLVSTYDVFMTLQDIMTLYGVDHVTRPSQACPTCVSLFEDIPDRRCEDAGIPMEWCTCTGFLQNLNRSDSLVNNMKILVMEKIRYLNFGTVGCVNVTSSEILSASMSEPLEPNGNRQYMFLVLRTKPFAIILTTVEFENYDYLNPKFFIRTIANQNFCTSDSLKGLLQ